MADYRDTVLTRRECREARKRAGGAYEGDGLPEVVAHCDMCDSPGYTDGWGMWHFECGRTALTCGEPGNDCGKAAKG